MSLSLCVSVSQDDREFRDKITPISVAMEYKLDYQLAADQTGLLPIIDMSAPSNVTKQVTHLSVCVCLTFIIFSWTDAFSASTLSIQYCMTNLFLPPSSGSHPVGLWR